MRFRDNITRMRREWEAQRGALATVRRFNAIMSSKGHAWFWPTIGAAVGTGEFFRRRRERFVALAARQRIRVIYQYRDFYISWFFMLEKWKQWARIIRRDAHAL